jgi:hypothetical protein
MRELPLPSAVAASPNAHEVLRAWIVDRGLNIAFEPSFEHPAVWGVMLVDIARHAARTYAEMGRHSEQEALDQIYEMFRQEWDVPTDLGVTTDLKTN